MKTIGEMVKKFSLSRSTLLYYIKIGLLTPANKTKSNYRLYSADDEIKLEKIVLYRKTGLSLKKIGSILEGNHDPALEERLVELDDELNNIRLQQKIILGMIQNPAENDLVSLFTPQRFSNMLKSTGMNDNDTLMLHARLELASPKEHKEFLRFLGLSDDACDKVIASIKEYIKKNNIT